MKNGAKEKKEVGADDATLEGTYHCSLPEPVSSVPVIPTRPKMPQFVLVCVKKRCSLVTVKSGNLTKPGYSYSNAVLIYTRQKTF